MADIMQPGKTYRLRLEGSKTFERSYFQDYCLYGGEQRTILGHIDAIGNYIGRVPVHVQHGNPHRVQGRIVGRVLECLDGRRFELIETDT